MCPRFWTDGRLHAHATMATTAALSYSASSKGPNYGMCVQESNDRITEGVAGSNTLIWMANHSVRVLPLPVLAAMNGHTAFVQELHLR